MSANHLLIIAGPTASGKSRLAFELAKKYPLTIINGDAMQLYDALPILTAQPTSEEQKQIRHLLYGIAKTQETWTVADWLEILQQAIIEISQENLLPVIVGGSNMYLDRLLNGLVDIPDIPDRLKQQAEAMIAQSGHQVLYDLLADEDRQRLHVNDTHRIIRSYCVYQETGHSLAWFHHNHHKPTEFLQHMNVKKIALLPDRQVLYQRCNQRLETMMAEGVLAEVEAILDEDDGLPICQAIGVKPFKSYLRGNITYDEALALAQQQTRNYAKRQYSWLNNHYHADIMLDNADEQMVAKWFETNLS